MQTLFLGVHPERKQIVRVRPSEKFENFILKMGGFEILDSIFKKSLLQTFKSAESVVIFDYHSRDDLLNEKANLQTVLASGGDSQAI